MKTSKILLLAALFGFIALILTSCFGNEDAGPLQEQTKEYSILGFERLEIGDALDVTVTQGTMYSVVVNGDRRNIDDLEVRKIGSTLKMNYRQTGRSENRQYTTYVTISMPSLKGVLFSAAVNSKITGFESESDVDLTLSGASNLQADLGATSIKLSLSGASELNISGTTSDLQAIVSGASELRAFNLETANATVDASGASKISVLATQQLKATASGASHISYRGNPTVNSSSSGASSIGAD